MANSVDLDETAKFEHMHLFLHNLQRYIFLSAGLKEVFIKFKMFTKENILEKEKKIIEKKK